MRRQGAAIQQKEGKCILLKCHRRNERIPIKSDTVKCIPKLYELPKYYTPTTNVLKYE